MLASPSSLVDRSKVTVSVSPVPSKRSSISPSPPSGDATREFWSELVTLNTASSQLPVPSGTTLRNRFSVRDQYPPFYLLDLSGGNLPLPNPVRGSFRSGAVTPSDYECQGNPKQPAIPHCDQKSVKGDFG